jgi:hypothetical protein
MQVKKRSTGATTEGHCIGLATLCCVQDQRTGATRLVYHNRDALKIAPRYTRLHVSGPGTRFRDRSDNAIRMKGRHDAGHGPTQWSAECGSPPKWVVVELRYGSFQPDRREPECIKPARLALNHSPNLSKA